MVRKISHIILSLLLMVSTMGLIVSKHYCHGNLVSVSFFHQADNCCGNKGCCHNENEFYKVKDDFSSSAVTTIPLLAELDILGHSLLTTESLLTEPEAENTTSFIDFSPPPKTIQTELSLKQLYLL